MPAPIVPNTMPDSSTFHGPVPVGEDFWIVRRLFSLGKGQKDGLTWEGLRDRTLALLGEDPMNHPALTPGPDNESTPTELEEERQNAERLVKGDTMTFPLDSTMSVIRDSSTGGLALHSCVECDDSLAAAVARLGEVTAIIVPNLQHWLFVPGWMARYPQAEVWLAPAACGEDLSDKLAAALQPHKGAIHTLEGVCRIGELEGRLVPGAPLALNEYVFHHARSRTLITSDSFYGGYSLKETPTWFARLWFKLTKGGSFRMARLPIYRTSRVLSHGSQEEVLSFSDMIASEWSIDQVVFAHGTSPFDVARLEEASNAQLSKTLSQQGESKAMGRAFSECWRSGLAALKSA